MGGRVQPALKFLRIDAQGSHEVVRFPGLTIPVKNAPLQGPGNGSRLRCLQALTRSASGRTVGKPANPGTVEAFSPPLFAIGTQRAGVNIGGWHGLQVLPCAPREAGEQD